jgi:SAM-dependent methyltransferase
LSVAHAFPKLAVVGIDVAPGMVRYGRACAWSQGLDNAHFEVSDATQPLPYAQGAFDLIHARFIVGFLDQGSWPPLLAECFRVLTAGGRLLLREAEMGISSSPALQQMSRFLAQAFYEQGRSFAPDRYSLGITHMLGKLLKQAGLVQVQHRPFLLDACAESELYYSTFREMEMVFALLKPYLLASGVVEEEAFEECYRQMLLEMVAEDFTCLSYGVQVWGAKPAQEVPDRSL